MNNEINPVSSPRGVESCRINIDLKEGDQQVYFKHQKSLGFFVVVFTVGIFFVIFGAAFLNISLEIMNFSTVNLNNAAKASEYSNAGEGVLPKNGDKLLIPPIKEIELNSFAGAVMETDSKKFLFGKNDEKKWPIASITKLMTALIFLDYSKDWEEVYVIKAEDRREGGRINVFKGEGIKVKDLFYASLVGSDNTATIALVHSTGLSEDEFVKKMNEKAAQLELLNTFFSDAVGLSNDNVSSAREVVRLAAAALEKKEISEATLKSKHVFSTMEGRKKVIHSTDDLLGGFPQNGIKILGGKTGYTEPAGYCFVGKFSDQSGREVISAVLGGGDNDSRFAETKVLVERAYDFMRKN